MIITEPNKFVAEVHDRMPVLLAEEDFEPWLNGKAGLELLKPAPDNALQNSVPQSLLARADEVIE